VIKQVPSLSVVTVAAIAAAVLSAPAAATLAQEQSLESRFLNGATKISGRTLTTVAIA
jgi:hypothetical protein